MNIDFLYSEFLEIKKISTDTRKPVRGTIFFCLKGKNFNGNEFALQAFKQGAKMIVTEETKYNNPEFFIVKDVLKCLQKLAEKHRANLNIPIIAITGTNGKTSTKNLISSISSVKRFPLHCSHFKCTSAINCISTTVSPSPLQYSHLPPSTLKEKYPALYFLVTAKACLANNLRISSYTFR